MALIFIRTAIIFITLLIVMRLMGKSQIGEMQPFEFVITLVIAELACIPMADTTIPLLYGIVAIIAIFVLHQLVILLDNSSSKMKGVICGLPSLVITRNGLDEYQLKKNNLDVSDLIESMRAAGYFNLDDVYYGLYEANGGFSALAKEQVTPSLAVTLIDGGKVNKHNLELCKISYGELENFVREQCGKIKNVLVMTVDGNGRVYFQQRGKAYKILHLQTGEKW